MAQILLSGSIGIQGSQSILGNATVNFSNSDITGGSHTLTAVEWANNFLSITSSSSLGSSKNLIAPLNVGQCFVIQNNTSGGQSIQVIGSTGTGVLVPNGSTILVVCDGTNYFSPGATASGGTASALYTNSGIVNVGNAGAPSIGQILAATSSSTAIWQTPITYISALTGDVSASGTGSVTATVNKINGISVSSSTSANKVLVATSSSATTWAQIADGYVSSTAAIQGTKILPAFGSQNVSNTGTLTVTGTIYGSNVISDGYFEVAGTSGPTITAGTGAPTSTPPGGSLYLRTDGVSSAGAYIYEAGAWTALGAFGAGGPPTGAASGDLTGSYPNPQIFSFQGNPIALSTPTDGSSIVWSATDNQWEPKPVTSVNGTSIPAASTANTVLVTLSGSTTVWSQIFDGYVASNAAIQGTKISPNFGSQNVYTTGIFEAGNAPTTGVTIFGSVSLPAGGDAFYAYNTNSNNSAAHFISSNASAYSVIEALNTGSGTSSTIGMKIIAGGTSTAISDWQGNGILEQAGSSTSAIVFSKHHGDGTARATVGRIWQTGAWGIGSSATNNTSSNAQAGLTGPLVNFATATGTLTTASNQALIYNSAGTLVLQGNSGVTGIVGTTTVLTSTTSGITTPSIGIGTGTPPTITSGSGVPSSSPPNGSLFMRTDGSSSTGLYTYQSGVWVTIGITYGSDLSTSTSTNQYVSSISGSNGSGGSVPLNITTLAFASGQATPAINQTVVAGTGTNVGQAFTIKAQAGQAQTGANANNNGGDIIIASGTAGTGGSGAAALDGYVYIETGTTAQITISPSLITFNQPLAGPGGVITYNATTLAFNSTQLSPAINQTVKAGTGTNVGQSLTIKAQNGQQQTGGANNNNGGNLILDSGSPGTGGSGTAGVAGNLLLGTDGTTQVTVSPSSVTFNQPLGGMTGTPLTLNTLLITLSNSDYTLSSSDMTYGIIEFNGTLGANRNILCPTINGATFIFSNKTTDGYNLTIHRADAGDGGVTLADGYNVHVYYDGVNDNSYEVAVSASTGGGGGGSNTVTNVLVNQQPSWSASSYLSINGTPSESSGSLTTAIGFTIQNPLTITGVKFYWAGTTSLTIKGSLWDNTGTRVATGTVAVSTAGTYTVNFGTAYTLSNAHRDLQYYVSIWENTGTFYTSVTQSSVTYLPAVPFIAGQYYTITNLATNASGDSLPNTVSGTQYYPLEPVFSGVYGTQVHTPNITANYTVVATDAFIPVNTTGGTVTISAPSNPVSGQQFTVQDVGGSASVNNITVSGNGNSILTATGSAATMNIFANYSSAQFTYNGTSWSLMSGGGGGGSVLVHTPNITASTYTATASDQFIPVDTTSNVVTITAPPSPFLGEQFTVQDVGGNASTNAITINGNGVNILTPIGSASTTTITSNYTGIQFTYNGSKWSMSSTGITMITERLSIVAGVQTATGVTYTVIGGTSIDMTNYPATANGKTRTLVFVCDFSVPVGTDTATIQLWDATNGVLITGAQTTTSSTTPVRFVSSTLTVGTSAGNIRTDVISQYQVQLAMTSGSTTDKAVCYGAYLRVQYT